MCIYCQSWYCPSYLINIIPFILSFLSCQSVENTIDIGTKIQAIQYIDILSISALFTICLCIQCTFQRYIIKKFRLQDKSKLTQCQLKYSLTKKERNKQKLSPISFANTPCARSNKIMGKWINFTVRLIGEQIWVLAHQANSESEFQSPGSSTRRCPAFVQLLNQIQIFTQGKKCKGGRQEQFEEVIDLVFQH